MGRIFAILGILWLFVGGGAGIWYTYTTGLEPAVVAYFLSGLFILMGVFFTILEFNTERILDFLYGEASNRNIRR